ncbi:hypothetical protein LC724_30645 [Blautia sp. RD014234]|nr:hypothetical protein [Blautia parvula]
MIAACVVVLLMVTYIPQISVCLPKVFAGSSYTGTSKLTDHADSTAGDNSSEDYNEIGDYSDAGLGRADLEFCLLHHGDQYLGKGRGTVRKAHGESHRRQSTRKSIRG